MTPATSRPAGRTRRAVVLGGAAALGAATLAATAGCEVGATGTGTPAEGERVRSAGATGLSTGAPTAPPGAEAAGTTGDAALVEEVLTELAATIGLLLAAQRGAPRLRPDVRPLLVLHGQHAALLGSRLPEVPGTAGRWRGAAQRLSAVRAREQRLERALADAAVTADSGPLARLLASMSVAVAQRLVVLPRSPR